MIVEDYQPLLQAMVQALEPLAESIVQIDNPVNALESIEKNTPDMLITDWDLQSHLNGGDMARFALQTCADIKVVIISGKELSKIMAATDDVDVFRYVAKPFALKELRQLVKECQ